MDWLFEARRDTGGRFPWISIPGVASTVSLCVLAFSSITNATMRPYRNRRLQPLPGAMQGLQDPFVRTTSQDRRLTHFRWTATDRPEPHIYKFT